MANTFKFGNGEWAVGKETALAYNDENSNFKPLPFTFDRASTATVVNKQGLIETVGVDEPRIDFLNNTKGHLLLEPSRSNLVTNSEQFVDAPTGNTNMDLFSGTITNNNTTSPDGNVKGMKFTISSGSGAVLRIYQSDLSTSANTTFSIYAKKGTTDSLSINIAGGTATIATLNDKWQRFSTTDTSSGSKFLDVEISGNAGEYIYIFGIQAEQGSYATSYIPTQGSAVTRNRDSVVQTVPDGIVQENEMTLYAEFEYLGGQDTQLISVHNNSNSVIWIVINGSNQLSGTNFYNSAFNASVTMTSTITPNTRYKVAYRTKSGDSALYVNGVSQGVSTQTISNNNTLRRIELGSFWNGINANTNSKIIEAKCYNNALTNSELATLTTL